MNKTKIEWCDYTWNPVTGCLHKCSYCYAERIANRFGGASETHCNEAVGTECQWYTEGTGKNHDLKDPIYDIDRGKNAPYPFDFDPTFHRYRLDEPQNKKRPSLIFVCSMADLFGAWVPDDWIKDVFRACFAAPQHKYLFLTKNAERYEQLGLLPNNGNYWYGTTRTGRGERGAADHGKRFLSLEPLLSPMDRGTYDAIELWDWVIIGAETGNRKEKVVPDRAWVDQIVEKCRKTGVPVFMKDSLKGIMGTDFVREWPDELKE